MKYPHLYQEICKLSPIPETEWQKLEEISTIKSLEKNTPVLRAGEQAFELMLIITGSVRMYYIEEGGKEFNHAFMFEGSIAAGYPSLISKTPSKFIIETMEDTNYMSIPYDKFVSFYDQNPCWDKLARIALEINYVDKLERESILLLGDTKNKYQRTLELYPQLENRIPQYHIASFLGVTASSLNRSLKN